MSEEKFSLKDHLFNRSKIKILAEQIKKIHPPFESTRFIRTTVQKFPELELKDRIRWIREQLKRFLPKDYRKSVSILIESLPPECDPTLLDDDFGDFIYAPYGDFIAHYGLEKKHLHFSLASLKETTKRFSAEDPIRYFLNQHLDETFETLLKWTKDSHYHVRRLCSEGTRPSLPWSQNIQMNYQNGIKTLDLLYSDPTRYVTRSVANHLNDISKIDPKLVLKTLKRWKKTEQQKESEMNFIIKHSLRTLVKKGHLDAIKFLGFRTDPDIQILSTKLKDKQIRVGETLSFEIDIKANRKEKLLIDYKIDFVSQNSKRRCKVFKIKQMELNKGQSEKIHKKHLFKRNMSTFKIYPGKHHFTLQINGQNYVQVPFEIV